MPIRASTLRSPARARRGGWPSAPSGVSVLGAARAGQLAGELEQQARVDDRAAPAATIIARPWTSSTSPASTTMSVRPRRPASASAVLTAPAASTDGTGRRPAPSSDGGRVGQDEDLGAGPGGVERAGARAGRARRSSPAAPGGGRPRRVEAAHGPVRGAGALADGVEQGVEVDDDGSRDADGRGARGHPAEERGPPAELHLEVHDRALALGVDRRVGDLGERLAQVVADGSRDAAAAGERRVVAHAPQRLVAVEGHGLDVEAQLLGVEAEQVAQAGASAGVGVRGRGEARRGRGGGGAQLAVGEHLARGVVERQPAQDPRLGVGVGEDRARPPGPRGASRPGARRPVRTISAGAMRHRPRLGRDGDDAGRGHGPRPRAGGRCGRAARRPAGRR